MESSQLTQTLDDTDARQALAIKMTAPGTALRMALDMILAGHLGALICVGDRENVLAAGSDGFALDVSFTANRLFELCKMDGAVVIDKDLTRIVRANFHLNPDASLPTAETGTRHRTAARMSLLTKSIVVAVSSRRSLITVYVDGRAIQLKAVPAIMTAVSQLSVAMQNTRQALDRELLRLTALELDNYVTLGDVAETFYLFEVLMKVAEQLDARILELGTEGKITSMQREEYLGGVNEAYDLMIRDYAKDSSVENARTIRRAFHETENTELRSSQVVGHILGYSEDLPTDAAMVPLGLRTLSRVSMVRDDMAAKIVDEYDSLQELLNVAETNPNRLGDLGIENPGALANALRRMWGKSE
ncbi:DNA integrity scanning diadenylate cyclase DisA [Lancefieldella sp. Marseille-Q7238]|uniref:DNA integrity scanning diadenylate cyclase DisA n=1 Tax=Lancefieldella sp. Marseille-Q7238 TaxID=3022127 RepID=UPI0024A7D734|nr:DNA integrity scanning diadenylate cyclase DisA [Lancefieldella sp. Marseille-Q7238]